MSILQMFTVCAKLSGYLIGRTKAIYILTTAKVPKKRQLSACVFVISNMSSLFRSHHGKSTVEGLMMMNKIVA